jgi:hypothetical protein
MAQERELLAVSQTRLLHTQNRQIDSFNCQTATAGYHVERWVRKWPNPRIRCGLK